ncbi:heavy-metal-associated domain-containing protein [Acidithiobacillus ferriphilus]|uniref:heavy-metal-associated domain-containing protein n=1 Tax=Acidithiobacillus ferriphilus TaxID=1689834 RepID=UPI001C06F96F|nr:cation transporter [Acidithiobacillus ferriphilus]MBU2855003.1 heavy-metal-associated domain-containing protein [Acidithiobacillus ferriphilus]
MNLKATSRENLVLISALSVILGSMIGMSTAWAAPASSVVVQAASATSVFKVPSMSCSDKACETAIYIALHRMPGVEHIQINDMKRTVAVTYDSKKMSAPVLLRTFQRIGYPASLVHG